jgi:putative DNA primase/helicase
LLIGRLKEHGDANYRFRAKEDPSYYVKLITSRGERTLWGKDLRRALTESETRPKLGDLVGARRIAREPVMVTSRQRDSQGRVTAEAEQQVHRTRWVVEKAGFFAERARMARRLRDEQADVREAVRAHPELKSTFLSVRAAEEFAAKRIANPQDRERFLELVRGAVASSIHKGEPLPSVRLREQPRREGASVTPPINPKRDDPTR